MIFFNRKRTTDKVKKANRTRRHRRRDLRLEQLEAKRLLAADFFRHNVFDAEDVNDDGSVSALDALTIINSLNSRSQQDTSAFMDVNNDGQRTALDVLMVVNRLNRENSRSKLGRGSPNSRDGRTNPDRPESNSVPEATIDEFRTIDGSNNNLLDPTRGSAGENLTRMAHSDYADGISLPAGEGRPSAREISNVLSNADPEGTSNDRQLSAFLYVWGQFIDHDIDLSLGGADSDDSAAESLDILVPTGDPQFDPSATGEATIPFTRSAYDPETGVDEPREQTNSVTTWIDGSMVYGSDAETAASLRSFEGGRLRISDAGLLPTDEAGDVLAGDIRAAENISLTSMHALFVREHNRIAEEIAANDSQLSDEEIYQRARAVVIAEIQAITFNEFLPALLGNRSVEKYQGYDEAVDATIANEFSTAAFRFGHSTLNDDVEFFGNDGRAVQEALALSDVFFSPEILEETGIDSVLKYDASTLSQEIDLEVVDSLRNLLFGPPGAGGLDLVALNIQRGRDHGLADYNSTREAYGLEPIDSFAELTSDVEVQQELESLYGDTNNMDLWVGLLAEDHVRGASVGELTRTIIADQFSRLRDGDRFWYENIFEGRDLQALQATKLSDLIERNTGVEGLQDNVFYFRAEIRGQVLAIPASAAASSNAGNSRGARATGVSGVTVELLSPDGQVLDSTVTDNRGNYRFRSFNETGDYQIRVNDDNVTVTSKPIAEVLIASGDTRIGGVDFTVTV